MGAGPSGSRERAVVSIDRGGAWIERPGKLPGVLGGRRRALPEVTERMMVRVVSVYETALNKAVEQFVDRVRGLVKEAVATASHRRRLADRAFDP